MAKYRKKPVVIEAWQFNDPLLDSAPRWLHDAISAGVVAPYETADGLPSLTIQTLEGEHRASVRDWIIQGVNGELCPCKPGIFAKTYEPA